MDEHCNYCDDMIGYPSFSLDILPESQNRGWWSRIMVCLWSTYYISCRSLTGLEPWNMLRSDGDNWAFATILAQYSSLPLSTHDARGGFTRSFRATRLIRTQQQLWRYSSSAPSSPDTALLLKHGLAWSVWSNDSSLLKAIDITLESETFRCSFKL